MTACSLWHSADARRVCECPVKALPKINRSVVVATLTNRAIFPVGFKKRKELLRAANENHAVVGATFSAVFANPMTSAAFRQLLSLHSKVASKFPRQRELKGQMLQVRMAGPGSGPGVLMGEAELGGVIFDSLKPDGTVERSIEAADRNFHVVRRDYAKWDDTWPEVQQVFELALPVLLEHSPVTGASLAYHDRFIWDGTTQSFDPASVLRQGSEYVVANVFKSRDLWHSFHGFFEYDKAEAGSYQLLNVAEVQFLPLAEATKTNQSGLALEIRLTHRIQHGMTEAVQPPQPIDGDAAAVQRQIFSDIDTMHRRHREIICRIINDEWCERIGLIRQGTRDRL